MIVINQEEVIKVSSDFSGRIHRRKEIKLLSLRKGRKDAGEHGSLDPRGK
jgi:hypothetical protein